MIIGAIWLCECLRGVGKSISALAYLGQVSVSFSFLLITSRPTELVKRKGGGWGDSAASSPEKRTRTNNRTTQVKSALRRVHACMHGRVGQRPGHHLWQLACIRYDAYLSVPLCEATLTARSDRTSRQAAGPWLHPPAFFLSVGTRGDVGDLPFPCFFLQVRNRKALAFFLFALLVVLG